MIKIIFSIIKTVLSFVVEKYEGKHKRNMAAIQAQTDILLDPNVRTWSWDMAQLNDKNKVIRMLAFLMFASPWFGYVISPDLGAIIERGWTSLPDWQANALSGFCLAVFGMQHIHNFIGGTFSAISKGIRK